MAVPREHRGQAAELPEGFLMSMQEGGRRLDPEPGAFFEQAGKVLADIPAERIIGALVAVVLLELVMEIREGGTGRSLLGFLHPKGDYRMVPGQLGRLLGTPIHGPFGALTPLIANGPSVTPSRRAISR